MKTIHLDSFDCIKDVNFANYARQYVDIEKNTFSAIAQFGLDFETSDYLAQENEELREKLRSKGAVFANGDKSIHINWISDACIACRTGEASHTTFISLKCHRDCYFCFNPNQQNFDYYQHHFRQAELEVEEIAESGARLNYGALTGGEPLLHKAETVNFFTHLHQQFPQIHSRLYTAGDPLDRDTVSQLKHTGLSEIRFSIKIDDPPEKQARILRRIRLAREFIPSVMVEMPVIPGTTEEMRVLLSELDQIGVNGINLLEFCFPLNNAAAFRERGFSLKSPPYQVYYNYWYAGSSAIAKSENTALALMLFALENKLSLGVHYCSLENKHTGQIYQQNSQAVVDDTYYFSDKDYFLKCAKVFGPQSHDVGAILVEQKLSVKYDLQHNFIQFHPSSIHLLQALDIEICLSLNVVEQHSETEIYIKEVQLQHTTPSTFEFSDI